jgi:hypothetical protein
MSEKRMVAEEIVKEMEENFQLSKIEELIKDNAIQFDYNEKKYRVRLLTMSEKDELDSLRRKKFNSMLQEKDEKGNYVYLKESALIKLLKERGDVDIEAIEDKINKLNAEAVNLQLRLGEAISKNDNELVLNTYKDQIEEILKHKIPSLRTEKNLCLGFSLENALLSFVSQVITYLSSEVLEEDKWVKVYKSFKEFQENNDETLMNQLAMYSMVLQPM